MLHSKNRYHRVIAIIFMIISPRLWTIELTTAQPRPLFKARKKIFSLPLTRVVAILVSLLFSYLAVTPAYGQEPVGLGMQDTSKKGNPPAELAIANMLQQKKEYKIEHDFKKPFVAHGNGVESESVLFQSVLTGYQKGHKGQMIRPSQAFIDGKLSINKGTSYRLGCYNTGLMLLYSEAFINGRRVLPRNKVLLEVKDSNKLISDLKGSKYVEWLEENGYCYELIMPAGIGRAAVYTQMQHDLASMFPQYTASIQKRKIESYALVRISKKDKLKTKGGKPGGAWDHFGFSMQNYYGLDYFLQQLEYYMQKELPLIDKTGYEGKIDIDLKANLSSIEELNKALAVYDLQFVRGLHTIDVLVISDSGREPIEFRSNPADYSDRLRNFDWQPLKKGGI